MVWPFKYVNGQQTEESKILESLPKPKTLSPYKMAISDPDTEDALL